MMKKVLALLLVITAAAYADIVDIQISSWGEYQDTTDPFTVVTNPITPTDYIEINPSEWVNLDIIYTDTGGASMGLISLGLDIIVTGPATLYVGQLGAAGDNTLLTFPALAWDLGKIPAPISFIGPAIAGGVVIDLAMNNGLMGIPDTPVVALDHILLHCDGPGLVTVTVVDDQIKTTGGGTYNMMMATPGFGPGVSILQVPEPMTVALLGLGGLFLRRRK